MPTDKALKWATEAAMMAVVQADARAWGFRVYPESGGHDLLLEVTDRTIERIEDEHNRAASIHFPVSYHPFWALRSHVEAGDVFAIEGKLRATFEVLEQAMPRGRRVSDYITEKARAADFYAIVVPGTPAHFDAVAAACGIIVMTCPCPSDWEHAEPAGIKTISSVTGDMRVVGWQRLQVPKIEVEMSAGHAAPRAITPWKVGAVELCLIAAHRPLRRADFKARNVSEISLSRNGWVACSGRGPNAAWTLTGKGAERIEPDATGRLVRGPRRPDLEYPEIVEALLRAGFDPAASGATPDINIEKPTLFRTVAT